MQSSCKDQKVFRSICSIPAEAKKFFAAFAAFLQSPKSFSRRLQHSCKVQKVFRDTCSIPAIISKSYLAVARLSEMLSAGLFLTSNSAALQFTLPYAFDLC